MAAVLETKTRDMSEGLDADLESQILTMMSMEGDRIEIIKKAALQSELIKTMVEGNTDAVIPVPRVKTQCLWKVTNRCCMR